MPITANEKNDTEHPEQAVGSPGRMSRRLPPWAVVWGVPFVLVGIYLIFGRFLLDAWVRGGTRYAVTNRRVLISRGRPYQTLIAVGLERLPEASISEGSGGRGTIRFGQASPVFGRATGFSAWTPSLDPVPQFIGIEDANAVFDLIQRALGSAGTA